MLRRTLGPDHSDQHDVRPDLPPIRVDPNQLELALLNLALNARDAMPYGGRLAIGGTRITTRQVPEGVGRRATMYAWSVSDSGDRDG